MNFTWCGQSCGSTSRAFIHEKIYDEVLERVKERIKHFKPGIPTDPATTMGAIVSKVQFDRVMSYIASAKQEGARLLSGGRRPNDPKLAKGFYVEPTVFADVTMDMRIAREEIFGPVLGILKWSDEAKMLEQVNAVEYGLTCSIWTNDISTAHRTASRSRPALCGSTRSASTSSARRSAASSNPASAARNASRRCSPSRRRRTSTSGCGRRNSCAVTLRCEPHLRRASKVGAHSILRGPLCGHLRTTVAS